jgi:peroxiredoxin
VGVAEEVDPFIVFLGPIIRMVKSSCMLRLITLSLLLLIVCFTGFSQEPQQYFGKLDAELSPDMVHVYKRVYYRVQDIRMSLHELALEKDAVVRVGEFIDTRVPSGKSIMLLVEPWAGQPYLWFDQNGNGTLEKSERIEFGKRADTPDLYAIAWLPIQNAYYKKFPVYIHYLVRMRNERAPDARMIEQSVSALAYGHVDVGGREVKFMYPFEPKSPTMSTTEGLFGVDVNGDGQIRNEQFSVETSYTGNDEIVFPLNDIFVSTSAIDMATGKIIVRQREKTDYHRIDLEVGKEMPDFTFTDLDGKTRHLSDFRGKYLMVDFWGAWCGDCTRETPFHLAAYERFKKRGFEILGLDTDEKIETVRAYMTQHKITWPQATNDSIKQMANVDYRIQEYPSTILLGPNGKVLVLDQKQLQGENLALTLDKLLPR